MRKQITAEDVVRDIEFELAQGAVSQDDLGKAIQDARRHHNKLRAEIFQTGDGAANREAIGKLLQANDMLITLLQATAASIQELKSKAEYAAERRHAPGRQILVDDAAAYAALNERLSKIDAAAMPKALAVELDLQPSSAPLISRFMNQARLALHNLALFYTRKLAGKQTAVNQVFGDELRLLMAQVKQLNDRVKEMEQPSADGGVAGAQEQ